MYRVYKVPQDLGPNVSLVQRFPPLILDLMHRVKSLPQDLRSHVALVSVPKISDLMHGSYGVPLDLGSQCIARVPRDLGSHVLLAWEFPKISDLMYRCCRLPP